MTQGLVEKLLPMAMTALMSGLKKNAGSSQGAESLSQALNRHDGSLLNDMSRVENDDVISDGEKILRHVFGNKQETTQRALAKSAGVDANQIGQLLAMAAPAILASLGQAKRQNNARCIRIGETAHPGRCASTTSGSGRIWRIVTVP